MCSYCMMVDIIYDHHHPANTKVTDLHSVHDHSFRMVYLPNFNANQETIDLHEDDNYNGPTFDLGSISGFT